MKLGDLNELWGVEIHNIEDKIKIHKLLTCVIILSDIIVMAILIYFMYQNNVDFVSYLLVMLMASFASFFAYSYFTKPLDNRVFLFYQKHKNLDLIEERYNIDADKLFSLVYCIGYKKLKSNKDFDYYSEALSNYCYNDYVNSSKFYILLSRYKSEEGSVCGHVIKKNKKVFFIAFTESSYDATVNEDIVKNNLVEEEETNGDN